jgi:putative transcriptional regulator
MVNSGRAVCYLGFLVWKNGAFWVNLLNRKLIGVKAIGDMNRIKEILEVQGRSQTWLASKIGRSYVVTTNYCNNKTQPSIPILSKIAAALGVDVRELLVGTKDSSKKSL